MDTHATFAYLQPILQTFLSVVVFALLLEWGKNKLQERKAAREAQVKMTAEVAVTQQTIAAEIPSTVWAWLRNEHEDNLRLRANELILHERALTAEARESALQYKVEVEMHTNLELSRDKIELEKRIAELEAQLEGRSGVADGQTKMP